MTIRNFPPPLVPFLFATLVVGDFASKALHIALHFHSLPFPYLVLYSPTLVSHDILIIILVRVLLQFSQPKSRLQWASTIMGGLVSLVTWGAASILFGFFMQTGAEVAWAASSSFLSDPAAMKILLSGVSAVSAAATILGLAACLIHSYIYALIGTCLHQMRGFGVTAVKRRCSPLSVLGKSWWLSVQLQSFCRGGLLTAALVSLVFLQLTRPSIPYAHLSGALPVILLDAFTKKTSTTEGCRDPAEVFPLWKINSTSPLAEGWSRASWLPQDPPPGFSRWGASPLRRAENENPSHILCSGGDEDAFFNPKLDPLKISNLGGDIFAPLQKAFNEKSVEINHIVLLTLESGRKEVFPMQQGTPLFDALLASHAEGERDQAADRLVKMTPIAQMLTGEYVNYTNGTQVSLSDAKWQDPAEDGMGGLNIRGALTGSSLTLKSILGTHCGVHPLPVDLLEEPTLEIYQPCLPQLFALLNQIKSVRQVDGQPDAPEGSESSPALTNPWKSVFMQSITDEYDRQYILDEHMGFNHKIVKNTISSPRAKYRVKGDEINYFGYAETELKPYVRDLFYEAANSKSRVFLSHVTSTTHHPWTTPDDFEKERYMGPVGTLNHDLMDKYLNAARFVDNWLGDIMSLLDETGIANTTLVVIVGDHGQAFGEDNQDVIGTYENGHISNFRVPLVFRHPHMPRIDITANATSLSIVPTILDMLVQSKSVDPRDSEIISAILPEYEGQSLIRPFVSSIEPKRNKQEDHDIQTERPYESEKRAPHEKHEPPKPQPRYTWNFGLINPGGSMISVMSASLPYRLVLPLRQGFEYVFSNLEKDPGELHRLKAWTLSQLVEEVSSKHDEDAVVWLEEAEQVGKWWVSNQRRIWGYRES